MQQCMIRNHLIFTTEQTPTKYLNGRKYAAYNKHLYGHKFAAYNKQFQETFPSQDFFPDISPIFSKIPDISLTAVKFPDISRFSRQVVTLTMGEMFSHVCCCYQAAEFGSRQMFKVAVGCSDHTSQTQHYTTHKLTTLHYVYSKTLQNLRQN